MNHKISIENLGPIQKIEKFEIKKANLVIGESASGKSLLAMAISFFNNQDLLELKELKELKEFLKDYFQNYQSYVIQYFYTDDLYIRINMKGSFILKLSNNLKDLLKKTQEEIDKYREFEELEYITNRIKKFKIKTDQAQELEKFLEGIESQNIKKIYNARKELSEKLNLLPMIFIPATRSFVSDFDDMRLRRLHRPMRYSSDFPAGNQSLRMFSDTYRRYLRRFDKLDKNYTTLIKGDVSKDEQRDRITFSTHNQKLDISQVSSGQKELFPILLILQEIVAYKESHLIIIEEPEAHLFPKDQRAIFDTIIESINKSESKVFITTHSPYMLMSANNLIEAKNKDYKKLESKFIHYDDVNVHKLSGGGSKSLMNAEDRLIDGEYIEQVVDEICDEYDEILNSKKN